MKIRYKNIDYLVMGICYFKNNKESHYLIEEEEKIKWISEIFIEVEKSKIPFNWSLSSENNSKYDFLCGYYELCMIFCVVIMNYVICPSILKELYWEIKRIWKFLKKERKN